MAKSSDDFGLPSSARLNAVLAEHLRALQAGQPVDRDQLLAQHPDLADELRSFFANRDALERPAAGEEPTIDHVGQAHESIFLVHYFGDYELLDEIARGGMGVVYKARQVSLNRVVAVKMILAGHLASAEEVQRFRQEAEAAANLDHPHIVPIYEIGEHQGQQYFSMGFVEGPSLAKRLAEGPLEARGAAELVGTLARAVQYAHEKGVIHRDLKPGNVLLDRSGKPRVTDFGLAKRLTSDASLTQTGQVLGTPSYMPPEQAAGRLDAVGPASDVYARGAILYAVLTGRPPFQAASSLDTLKQVLDREPVALRALDPAIPKDLETVALKCLEKSIPRRYATAQELADELERFLDGRPVGAGEGKNTFRGKFSIWNWPGGERVQYIQAQSWPINQVHFSPDSRSVATVETILFFRDKPGKANVFDASTGERRFSLQHPAMVYQCVFNPQGGQIATACQDGNLRLWDAADGKLLKTIDSGQGPVGEVAYSHDGRLLATAGNGQIIKLWNSATGASTSELDTHAAYNPVYALAFDHAGERLAGTTLNRSIYVWNVKTKQRTHELLGHGGPVSEVRFTPDDRRLVSCSSDGTVKVWDPRSGQEVLTLRGPKGSIASLGLPSDGWQIAASTADSVLIWDATPLPKAPP